MIISSSVENVEMKVKSTYIKKVKYIFSIERVGKEIYNTYDIKLELDFL